MIWKSEEVLLKGLPDNIKPRIYSNNSIAVCKPKNFIVDQECCFEQYHFSIPTVTPPTVHIGEREYSYKANRIFALNPEEPIVCRQRVHTKEYTAMFVNKSFLQDIAYSICGRSVVQFDKESTAVSKRLKDSLENFTNEFITMKTPSPLMLESICTQIAVQLLREVKNNLTGFLTEKEYSYKSRVKIALDFIEEYYNSDISLEDLSKVSNLSPYHFIRVFKAETGKTPHEYLLDKKIETALGLLGTNQYTLGEVAQICGFISQSHFSTTFRKKVGVNPMTYKKNI